MHWIGLLLMVLSYFLEGIHSEVTIDPVSTTAVAGADPSIPAVVECRISIPSDEILEETDIFYSWLNPENSIISYNQNAVGVDRDRIQPGMRQEGDVRILTLMIDPVQLSDQGSYQCQFFAGSLIVKSANKNLILIVNQLPEVMWLKKVEEQIIAGSEATFASCHADLSKPPPEMWFEDSDGNRIDGTGIEKKNVGNGLTNSTLNLTKAFTRADNNKVFYCVIRHVNKTEPYRLEVGRINVRYPPTVTFMDATLQYNPPRIVKAGNAFSASCIAEGNPIPDLSWAFYPDVQWFDDSNSTTISSQALPENFIITDDGSTIKSTNLEVGNNGTYDCQAFNGIGSMAIRSFKLEVFELRTTTQSTTKEAATAPLPQQAGSNGAVIGGVVAVVIFILIVATVILVRYFMTRKGEYYTNEFKETEEERVAELSEDSDDELPRTEFDLLGERRREEHFM